MECKFFIQDPTNPNTTYLHESIIEQVRKDTLESWSGTYAFATRRAINALFLEDPDISKFAEKGHIHLIVGIDAVTNASALEALRDLTKRYDNFKAEVFISNSGGLFHPKLSIFQHSHHETVLILGSGNFTEGGLRNNTEAYCVISGSQQDIELQSVWDDFVAHNHDNISVIDERALELASQNIIVNRRKLRSVVAADVVNEVLTEELNKESQNIRNQENDFRVLVAEVPRAGNRWKQIHYNREVIDQFFRVEHDSSQRVQLQQVFSDGTLGDLEIRPVVYSQSNRNLKIEVSAGSHISQLPPLDPTPIIVLLEMGVRIFKYMLLFSSDVGYSRMQELLSEHPSIGRGNHRSIISYGQLKQKWPDTPI